MDTTHLRRLFDHMWWADDLAAEALERADTVPAGAGEIYAHVLGAELVWLDRVEQAEPSVAIWPEADLAGCRELARRARQRYGAYLETVSPENLPRAVHYRNSAGQEFETPLEEILLHVALHGAYHRGQVALLLRRGGEEPNPTDYIGFVRGTPAATTSR